MGDAIIYGLLSETNEYLHGSHDLDWILAERAKVPGSWLAVKATAGTGWDVLSDGMLRILGHAWSDGHESGFWNGRESAGSGDMELCGVEHARANNPYNKEAQ